MPCPTQRLSNLASSAIEQRRKKTGSHSANQSNNAIQSGGAGFSKRRSEATHQRFLAFAPPDFNRLRAPLSDVEHNGERSQAERLRSNNLLSRGDAFARLSLIEAVFQCQSTVIIRRAEQPVLQSQPGHQFHRVPLLDPLQRREADPRLARQLAQRQPARRAIGGEHCAEVGLLESRVEHIRSRASQRPLIYSVRHDSAFALRDAANSNACSGVIPRL